MALSKEEQRVLAEIERRLIDDDPMLASRLTSFRLPRLTLAPRSPRARLLASLLMLAVVAVVSVFVYALMPFRGQTGGPSKARISTSLSQPGMSAQPNVGQTSRAKTGMGESRIIATNNTPASGTTPGPNRTG